MVRTLKRQQRFYIWYRNP